MSTSIHRLRVAISFRALLPETTDSPISIISPTRSSLMLKPSACAKDRGVFG